MARPLWQGAISFGLVNVPVELYPAEDRKTFKFSMLDKRDLTPVGYKRFSKATGKEVEWSDIVKGYEYEKGQYVVLSDEDFRRANVKATQTIDIHSFVGDTEIPLEYFETPYYVAPGKRGEKAYALLRDTLKITRRIALAQVVIRTTQHLAAVLAHGSLLMMITLRYQDELRPTSDIGIGDARTAATAKEKELAKRLVDGMTERWDPKEFKDTYHSDLMARIDEKIKAGETKEITAPGKEPTDAPKTAQIIDLAELLKRSLEKGDASRRASKSAPPARVVSKSSARARPASVETKKKKRA